MKIKTSNGYGCLKYFAFIGGLYSVFLIVIVIKN